MKKVLSLDIGGTNTRIALVNENFVIEKELIYPTIRNSKEAFLANIKKIIIDLDVNLDEVIAFGAGLPGVINRETGYIYDLSNVHISDIPFGEFIYNEFHKKVYVRNDAEVAALAEATLGKNSKYSRVFFITISTGLGGALVIDKINQDYVTEIGHTAYKYHGQMTEYELIASGNGIVNLCNINGLSVNNSGEFFTLVKNSDPKAIYVYKQWLSVMTDFINMIEESYYPDVICVTGGVMKAKDIFFKDLCELNPLSNIVECAHSDKAGIVGAAIYAFQQFDTNNK